jgi:dihydrofolate reductase
MSRPRFNRHTAPLAESARPAHDGAMARLIYSATASLDGRIEDANGDFRFAAPDWEVHAHINDLMRGCGLFIHGRRVYELMTYWESFPDDDSVPPVAADFGRIWRGVPKLVYSRTLAEPQSANTAIEREFDAAAVRARIDESGADASIGGAQLGGLALAAGIVDELILHTAPIVVGGGKPWLPAGVALDLELLDHRVFPSGFVYSRYAVRR